MRSVSTAELKARLSGHLRSVQDGGTVTVLDRDTPVARIIQIAAPSLEVQRGEMALRDLKLPPKLAKRTDSLALLLDDRRRR